MPFFEIFNTIYNTKIKFGYFLNRTRRSCEQLKILDRIQIIFCLLYMRILYQLYIVKILHITIRIIHINCHFY